MFFRQILHHDLGCASYVIAARGEALVVDPKWDIGEYLAAAQEAGANVRHVVETHFHADHVSGRRRLADATGAVSHVPVDPQRPCGGGLKEGDVLRVGNLQIDVIATPGHRPEHLAYLVSDPDACDRRSLLLSGDSLLVGELARPDLAVAATEGARMLWGTVRRLLELDQQTELWPGHVGGSLCGSATLSEQRSSTIGEQLRTNPLLSVNDVNAFVATLNRSIPTRPPRAERVAALNLDGASEPGPLRELDAGGLAHFVSGGAAVLDVRSPDVFDHGHLTGAVNLPSGRRGVGTRAGWAISAQESIVVVAGTLDVAMQVASVLYAAGVCNLAGVSVADPVGWIANGLDVRRAGALTPEDVVELLSARELQLVDVRDRSEWCAGHVCGSLNLPLSELGDGRAAVLPARRPLAVACATGPRAALAASVLRRRGHADVKRVKGGIGDLAGARVSLVTGSQ